MQPVEERSITSFNNQVYNQLHNEIILNTTDLPTTSSIKWPEELGEFQEYETDFYILLQKGWTSNLPRPLNYYYGFKAFPGKEHESLLVGEGKKLSNHTLWNIFIENFKADFYRVNSRNDMLMPDFDSNSAAKIRLENALNCAYGRLNQNRKEEILTAVLVKKRRQKSVNLTIRETKFVRTNQRPNFRLCSPELLDEEEFGKSLLYIFDIENKERHTLMPKITDLKYYNYSIRNPYSRENLLNEMQYCEKLGTEWKKQFKSAKEEIRTLRISDQHRMFARDERLIEDFFMSHVRAEKIKKMKSHILSVTKDVIFSVDQKKIQLEGIT